MADEVASELPERIRAFVAIFPPPHVVQSLVAIQDALRPQFPPQAISWTKPEQIHLTLSFLGDVEISLLSRLQFALESETRHWDAVELQVGAIGCFPGVRKPRVLWAGFTGGIDSLRLIKLRADECVSKSGIPSENRPFHPHMTVGRVRHPERRFNHFRISAVTPIRWTSEEVFLVRSSSGHYSILNCWQLTERARR